MNAMDNNGKVEKRGNMIYLWHTDGSRATWELDPNHPEIVVQFREEIKIIKHGRFLKWTSWIQQTWQNPDYVYAPDKRGMKECPPIPASEVV